MPDSDVRSDVQDHDQVVGERSTVASEAWSRPSAIAWFMGEQLRKSVHIEATAMEASWPSGMKAAINGVPSLSVLDGWCIEGHVEAVTGWSIGERVDAGLAPVAGMDACHAGALYDKLAKNVAPCFCEDRSRFIGIMRYAIALSGGFFNTYRMMVQ